MRIALVGSGVSGLTAAYLLSREHEVTLFEADDRLGGHAHTVDVDGGDGIYPVDTGFLVYNESTYPNLIRLFQELGVETRESVMSFSYTDVPHELEWKGSNLATVFAQWRNLVRPTFWRMLLDIVAFNRRLRHLVHHDAAHDPDQTLEQLLGAHQYSAAFTDWYLIPMGAAIWSANPERFLHMPARSFAEFFSRHGLLNVRGMPIWRTVVGGSRTYVEAIGERVRERGSVRLASPVRAVRREASRAAVTTDAGTEWFDHVVVACHADQALALLEDPTPAEADILGAIDYQDNAVTLHWDTALLPTRRRVWAAWNYRRDDPRATLATLTYDISTLQSITAPRRFLVSLNSDHLIDPTKVLRTFTYAHPVLDDRTVAAQRRRDELFSATTSYCGAYLGFGFHEDGARSGVEVARRLGVDW